MNITQAFKAMFIGESDFDRKLREGYVNDCLAQHYFDELRHKCKVKGIFLKDRLLKWKQSPIYVPTDKLHIKVLKEVHNVSMVGYQGEKTTRTELSKSFY